MDEQPLTTAEFDRANAAFLEQAPAATILIDANARIIMVNGEAERLFGYYREELLGQPFETLLETRSQIEHAAERELFLADPRVSRWGSRAPLIAHTKNGHEFPIDVALRPIETAEGLLVAITIADISERLALAAARERIAQTLAGDALSALDELEAIAGQAGSHDVVARVKRIRTIIGDVLEEPEMRPA